MILKVQGERIRNNKGLTEKLREECVEARIKLEGGKKVLRSGCCYCGEKAYTLRSMAQWVDGSIGCPEESDCNVVAI